MKLKRRTTNLLAMALLLFMALLLLAISQAMGVSLAGTEPETVPTPSSDWRVYTDDRWGYSVKYPPDWTARVELNNIGGPEYVVQRRVTFVGPEYAQVDIDVYENRTNLGLVEWCDAYQQPLLPTTVQLSRQANARIAGVPAVVVTSPEESQMPAKVAAILLKADKVFKVTYICADGGAALNIYTRMLSALEFPPTIKHTVDELPQLAPIHGRVWSSVPDCCGLHYEPQWDGDVNTYPCCGFYGGKDTGNCTWYAKYRRHELGNWWGDPAGDPGWVQHALDAGFTVGKTPQEGSTVVFDWNHVAHVEYVNGGSYHVKEQGWCLYCTQDHDYDQTGDGVDFIYHGSPDLHQCRDLTNDPESPMVGTSVTFDFRVCNEGDATAIIENIGPIGRRPDGGPWDAFINTEVTVVPGDGETIRPDRTFDTPGTWRVDGIDYIMDGSRDRLPANGCQYEYDFCVRSPDDLKQCLDLEIRPDDRPIIVGEEVRFVFDVCNGGCGPITFQYIGPEGRSPSGGPWDAFWDVETTINRDQTLTIETRRTFNQVGTWCVDRIAVQFTDDPSSRQTLRPDGHDQDFCFEVIEPIPTSTHTPTPTPGTPTATPTPTPSDTTPPTGYFWRPRSGDATNMDSVTIEAQAYDSESGVAAVEFWVWVDEDHWEFIDTDIDGWDGWQAIWDVSQIYDQTVWLFLRIRDNAGNEVWNPDNSAVWFMIDRVAPTGEIISPAPDFYIHSDQADIVATASDDRSGVIGLQFFVWYDDGNGYDWHGLPLDWDGSDGWTSVWDTSSVEDQESIWFWIYIFDYAGNIGAYSHGGIILDRVPPCILFGDFTCDCDVDVQDIQQVASRWRMVETDPNWDALYDLNGDGIITVVDVMLVSAHWGETCQSQQTCVPDWTLACGGSDWWNNGNIGSTDRIDTYSCTGWDESGPEYAYTFVPSVGGQVDVSLSDLSADLDLFIVAPGCNAANCLAYGDETVSFDAVAGELYYIVVDGYEGAVGDYTISVSCPAGAQDQGDQEPGKSPRRFNFVPTVAPEVATPHPTVSP